MTLLPTRWYTAGLALLALTAAIPATAGDRANAIEGLLVQDDLDGEKIERKLLREGIRDADKYRTLTALYVLRAPSLAFWEDQMAPALEGAMESDRPIETLRGTLLGMEDLLVAGPDDAGVQLRWKTPAGRGQGFINLVTPVLIGPDGGMTGHRDPNKLRVVSGWFVDETRDDPVIEAVGLKSYPDSWTGGDLRMPSLTQLPDRGEGRWVKYKGRSEDGGEALADAVRAVERVLDRDSVRVDKVIGWPQESGERLRDTLTSARYRSRAPEAGPGQLLAMLRSDPVEDWGWDEKKIKHPTRYGVAVMSVNAETEKGDELSEVFAFVYLYTPLFQDFEEAHLYVGTSPEFFAKAVQKGEIPFFERGGEPMFYSGHLDRWVTGEALESKERPISRRIIEKTADRWARDMDSRDARNVMSLAKEPMHWPVRMVAADDDDDRPFKIMAHKDDLVSWWRRFERSLRPEDLDWFDAPWSVRYTGVAPTVDLGVLFEGKTDVEVGTTLLASADEPSNKLAERESASLSDKDRQRIEEERKQADAERSAAERERRQEEDARAAARKQEEARLAKEEAAREAARIAQQNAPIDVRLREVLLGAREEGKPYLATRAGKSLQVKVKYDVEGKSDGHVVQVVAQAYDRFGAAIPDFAVTSTKKAPTTGENETTTWLKVPSNYTGADKEGSYRVLTRLELDGVPVKGDREEFVHVGTPLAVPKVELDPSVVVPGEEAVLLMDLSVGGWSVEDDVPLQVSIAYKVGDVNKADSFPMTRGVGYHELEVDLDVPLGLPPGDGEYVVTVLNEASGLKASAKGALRVFAKEIVQEEDTERRGRRQRVAVEEDAELAALAKQAKTDDDDDRDVVRRQRDDQDDFDFDTFDEAEDDAAAEEEAKREAEEKRKAEAAKRKEDERRKAESDQRKEDERRKAESDQRKEDERRKAESEKRKSSDSGKSDSGKSADSGKSDSGKSKSDKPKERASEDEDDLDLDGDDVDLDRKAAKEEPSKAPKEEVVAFDWDSLPESVFFEEEEEEVMMWAEADGVGVVRVYGDPALDLMGTWFKQGTEAAEAGAPEWLWICHEGSVPPLLRFYRYSGKEGEWVLVHQSPIKFGSREEKEQALALMKAIFGGFVPEKKKKVPFGKL